MTNQLISDYLKKTSSLKDSTTYRICSNAFSSVDRLWDRLYDFALKTGKTSTVISFVKKTFCSTSTTIAYSLLIVFFSCGFGVTSILLGTFDNIKALLLVIGFLVSTALLFRKSIWLACLKGSLFWRIILYVFD